MSARREILTGIVAALISIIILGGSVLIATTETRSSVAMEVSPSPTFTSYPTQIILVTQRPGEPTYTPSPTALPSHTPPPIESATCPQPPGWSSIIVYPGDTLESLAQTYNTTPQALKQANCLVGNSLASGSLLYVPGKPAPTAPPCGPPPGWNYYYIVKSGDTLYSISRAHGVSVAELQMANCLSSTLIRVGQKLHVPNAPTSVPTSTPKPRATATPRPSTTWTPVPPSITPTNIPPSDTPGLPSQTPTTPTQTPTSTATTSPDTPTPTQTETPTPTETPPSPTSTNTPTDTSTPEPPTNTPTETATPIPLPTR